VTLRIAAAQISHETNVFSSVKTDLAAFERSGVTRGAAIVERERGTNSAFGGFIAAAEESDFELIPILSVWATPSGIVTADAISALVAELQAGLRAAGKIDAVLLGLHGAMVTEIDDDGDGYILAAVREVVGWELPVVATLDLHANITVEMLAAATMLIGYDTYPHVDMAERAQEAASLIVRLIAGEVDPTISLVQPPMLPTSQRMMTGSDPMRSIIALAHEMERLPRVVNVTVACGFPPADVENAGVSILVTTHNDADLADDLAHELSDAIWAARDGFLGGVSSFAEAADAVRALPDLPARPLLLVDIADNPWSGSPGDSAELLRFLLAEGVTGAALAMIVDSEAVQMCVEAGIGATVDLLLGGKTDTLHGPPLPVTGRVRLISDGRYVNFGPMMAGLPVDLGPAVVLACGEAEGIDVLITSFAETPIDLNVFRAHGIDPTTRRVIALKGKGHFRAAFEPIASQVILVEGPGISGADLSRLPLRNVRRPIWPLDEGATYE
jgi:microcystin degradation protein MlrC